MSDLVERLRMWPAAPNGEDTLDARFICQMLAASVAEIERLRETVRRVQASARTLSATQEQIYDSYRKASVINTEAVETLDSERAANAMLTEEVERLRAALEAIQWEAERENGGLVHMKRCIAVQARQALKGPTDDRK